MFRFTQIRREEVGPLLASALAFFFVLTALMVLRPAREALGLQRGIATIRWLFVGTAVVTLAVNPAFGWAVSRFRRVVFINATYLFFAASLLVFYPPPLQGFAIQLERVLIGPVCGRTAK